MNLADLTCIFPLYQSKRFEKYIRENVTSHLQFGAKIILSDQHHNGDDYNLESYFADEINVQIFRSNSKGDWIDNINYLLSLVDTKYVRIIPHDDTVYGKHSVQLYQKIKLNESAIVSVGITLGLDINNNRLPQRDEDQEIKFIKESNQSRIDLFQEFFFRGRYSGGFKGVINMDLLKQHNLFIKKTKTRTHSERLWLNAFCLIGDFIFSNEIMMYKRYYSESTHRKWEITPEVNLDCAECLNSYIEDLIPNHPKKDEIKFNILLNFLRRYKHASKGIVKYPFPLYKKYAISTN